MTLNTAHPIKMKDCIYLQLQYLFIYLFINQLFKTFLAVMSTKDTAAFKQIISKPRDCDKFNWTEADLRCWFRG